MPTVRDLEIVGRHAEADGIRIEGAMQPTLARPADPPLPPRHPPDQPRPQRPHRRLPHLRQHAASASSSTASTCTRSTSTATTSATASSGGIEIVGSEIRNIQICGNDIEYNSRPEGGVVADVLLRLPRRHGARGDHRRQHHPGGRRAPAGPTCGFSARQGQPQRRRPVRDHRQPDRQPDDGPHLRACRGVVVSAATASTAATATPCWAEDCEHLVVSGNSIDHNPRVQGAIDRPGGAAPLPQRDAVGHAAPAHRGLPRGTTLRAGRCATVRTSASRAVRCWGAGGRRGGVRQPCGASGGLDDPRRATRRHSGRR